MPHGVFAFDRAFAVGHALQEGHQHQVRRDLMVSRRLQQRFAMLPPEFQKRSQQQIQIQSSIRLEPSRVEDRKGVLCDAVQYPGKDLLVDRVGHTQSHAAFPTQQAQIAIRY